MNWHGARGYVDWELPTIITEIDTKARHTFTDVKGIFNINANLK